MIGDAVHLDRTRKQYIGWNESNDIEYLERWTLSNLKLMQQVITEALKGVHPSGRDIEVPIDTIANIMSSIQWNSPANVGDIFTRYIQAPIENRNHNLSIQKQTIEIITNQIRNEYMMAEQNSRLSQWNVMYGDFNPMGIRQHSFIKLREKAYHKPTFNMRY